MDCDFAEARETGLTYCRELLRSWASVEEKPGELAAIEDWYEGFNRSLEVNIEEAQYGPESEWYYDSETGAIRRRKGAFFTITGLRSGDTEQPVIIQDEIGYLGILVQKRQGVWRFLMQAKIEPGNVNKIQISPTIQATRSNFLQAHGGRRPNYLDYFLEAERYTILYDQIQSEQSSRFYAKRNRNFLLLLPEGLEVEEQPRFRWLSLGQIKRLMRRDNIVNMDSRTVLFGVYSLLAGLVQNLDPAAVRDLDEEGRQVFSTPAFWTSLVLAPWQQERITQIYRHINNYKMLTAPRRELCSLGSLSSWSFDGARFHSEGADFELIYRRIAIEDREVRSWEQPLFKACGKALFCLLSRETGQGEMEFLVHATAEPGCHDHMELGPSWQVEASARQNPEQGLPRWIAEGLAAGRLRPSYQVTLSEEGGRFYHEENENLIVPLNTEQEAELADLLTAEQGYFWLNLRELASLGLINNVINIQLRNLLALWEAKEERP